MIALILATEQELDESIVSPGVLGFVATFALAVAVIVLMRLFVRSLRKLNRNSARITGESPTSTAYSNDRHVEASIGSSWPDQPPAGGSPGTSGAASALDAGSANAASANAASANAASANAASAPNAVSPNAVSAPNPAPSAGPGSTGSASGPASDAPAAPGADTGAAGPAANSR